MAFELFLSRNESQRLANTDIRETKLHYKSTFSDDVVYCKLYSILFVVFAQYIEAKC